MKRLQASADAGAAGTGEAAEAAGDARAAGAAKAATDAAAAYISNETKKTKIDPEQFFLSLLRGPKKNFFFSVKKPN